MFFGANRVFTKVPKGKVEREKRDKERTPKQQKARVKELLKRDEARSKKIAEVRHHCVTPSRPRQRLRDPGLSSAHPKYHPPNVSNISSYIIEGWLEL
eukprot:1205345-Pyramimonas_sp.AAC.1